MDYFLFVFYILLFSFLIYRYKIYRYFDLSPKSVLLLFLMKVFAGVAYTFVHYHYYGGGDVNRFHKNALWVYRALADNPLNYLKLVFGWYGEYVPPELAIYEKHILFWGDNGSFFLVRILAIFDIITRQNVYINTIFFEMITMVGLLSLYKIFHYYFPDKKSLLLMCVFAIPSALFWSSGIHKDGLILTCTGLLFMCANDLVVKGFHAIKLFICIICIILLLMIRGYDIIIMFPGLAALYWTYKMPKYKLLKFSFVYAACILLFFFTDSWFHLGFVNFILQKQKLFIEYGLGNSLLRPLMINNHPISFLMTAPHAIYRALFRPNIFQYHTLHELIYAIINTLFLIHCFLLLFFINFKKKKISGLALFCIFYSILMMVFIGWIVPNVGAMVRYTSCVYPFFTLFFVLVADEKKMVSIPILKRLNIFR
ncbi:MAG: hypothetical protein RL708_952 [Bacteroidota bacterium]